MTTVAFIEHAEIPATNVAGISPVFLPSQDSLPVLHLEAPDFGFVLVASLIDYRLQLRTITFTFPVDDAASLLVSLDGTLNEGKTLFNGESASARLVLAEERPQPDFVTSTLMALFGLSQSIKLQVTDIGLALDFSFHLPLIEISKYLKRRQIHYRLMVIERLTGVKFRLPTKYSEDDIRQIGFVYRAVVERSFNWGAADYSFLDAGYQRTIDKYQSVIGKLEDQKIMRVKKESTQIILLGKPIFLGEMKGEIDIGSGLARFEFINAPTLPQNAWEPNIQALIDLESKLDTEIVKRYNALAAATLSGLTAKQVKRVTTRPKINFERNEVSGGDPD